MRADPPAAASVIRVEGVFDAPVARRLAAMLVEADAGRRVQVDLTHVREFHDVGVVVLGQALARTHARVTLRGLRQHQLAVLRYFGVDPRSPSSSRGRRRAAGGAADEEGIMREHEGLLGRLEERLIRMSGWLAARRGAEGAGAHHARDRLDALRRELARARRAVAETARADLERVRDGFEDLKRDYDAPPPHTALSRAELEAFRRHLHTTARLVRDLSTADSPAWNRANEEYERSWAEVERAFESEGGAASP